MRGILCHVMCQEQSIVNLTGEAQDSRDLAREFMTQYEMIKQEMDRKEQEYLQQVIKVKMKMSRYSDISFITLITDQNDL